MQSITGLLKEDSELREIFPDGLVPLKSAQVETARGRDGEIVKLYLVDLDAMTDLQITEMLLKFHRMGIGADLNAIRKEGYRIQTKHFSSVAIPRRLIE